MARRPPRALELLTRRTLLLASLGSCLLPWLARAGSAAHGRLAWEAFLERMQTLAAHHAAGQVDTDSMAGEAAAMLQRLDTGSGGFTNAVTDAWESGNRYWLWQRLTRADDILGGILSIDNSQDVPLHDHPGATGILRVLSGNLEIWQFDPSPRQGSQQKTPEDVVLHRVSHRMLQPGDIAILRPDRGNIHALKAISSHCSMLDYFIPPYRRQQRCWYQPLERGWESAAEVACRCIPEQEYPVS